MLAIPEPYILIRVPGELPIGLRLRTHEFRAGWNLAWSLTTERLEDKIRAHGWKFIKIANRSMSGAVGDTSQDAIGRALQHALSSISEHTNVVEISHINLTQYPWFFLASVEVLPFRIQRDVALPPPSNAGTLPIASLGRRWPRL